MMQSKLFAATLPLLLIVELCTAQKVLPYKNPKLSAEQRAADLIKRMTLGEKVAQMQCINYESKDEVIDAKLNIKTEVLKSKYSHGLGQIAEFCKTRGWLTPRQQVEAYNTIQKFFIEQTRLGIPFIAHDEALHGITAKGATSFPQPIAMAGTFNPELVKQAYTLAAHEARSRGIQQVLTPVLDVEREPRWGRCEETFGEDPFLVGEMGVAAASGLQGNLDSIKVIATLKHFAAHAQPENGTNTGPVNVSERVLREVFLYPFQQVIKRTGVGSLMASYNEIDGVPSHASKWLLQDILRKEWGFKGYVVSDYFALGELAIGSNKVGNRVAADWPDAARMAVEAGVNIELPIPQTYVYLPELVKKGLVSETKINQLVESMLLYKFKLGLFDHPYLDPAIAEKVNGTAEGRKLALEAARQSIVMLKNKQAVAPLNLNKYKTIAVIGPNADRELLGEYSGQPKQFVTVLQGLKERVGNQANIVYAEGCKITTTSGWYNDSVALEKPEVSRKSIMAAMKTARTADVIVLAVGGNEQTSREAWNLTHKGDRSDLDLVGSQNELIDSLATLGKPIVAVVINGSPLAFNNLDAKADVLFECWYLGQECGYAIADVLQGRYNPSAKLSVSIPRSVGQLPVYYNYKPMARRSYLFSSVTPLYPFGYGLSYTTFKVENVKLTKPSMAKDGTNQLTLTISNTGKQEGAEVVQLYIRDLVSSVTRPVKELKAFQRVNLKAGETKPISFNITPAMLAFYNIDMKYLVEPGQFELMVGTSSQDTDLQKIMLSVAADKK